MSTISVIIPAYNVEKYIARCINSLIYQKCSVDYSVIIVDDGSVDRTSDIIQEYVRKYPRIIRYLYKENGGQSSARNTGLEHSESDYVIFVDSDDYVEPDYIDALYKLVNDTDSDVAMCAMNRVSGDDGKGSRFDSGFSKDFVTDDIDCILMCSSFAPWNKIFKRSIIGELRFPEGMTYEDFALIPQVINRAKRIAYTDKVLYHYFFNENSTITSATRNKKTNRNILTAQHILEESELKGKPEILENFYLRRVLSSMAWSLLEYHEGNNEVKKLVDEANTKYPNIKNNPWINSQPRIKRMFMKSILDGKISWGGVLVSVYSLMRSIYKFVRK